MLCRHHRVWLEIAFGGCFATLVSWSGKCFATGDLRCLDDVVSFNMFSSVVGARFVGSRESSPPPFLACCWVVLPIKVCISRTAFLLMKYVLRHVREKK